MRALIAPRRRPGGRDRRGASSPRGVGCPIRIESHDRGATWSAPEHIAYALTRTGLSCSVDASRGAVVLAFEGSGDEGIWITQRPLGTPGPGQWQLPNRLSIATNPSSFLSSHDSPRIQFDFFSGSANGRLVWFDNFSLRLVFAPIVFSSVLGKYVLSVNPTALFEPTQTSLNPARTMTVAETLRATPPSVFDGKFVTAYSLAFSTSWRRVQHFDPWIQTSSVYQTYTIPASNVVRTVDAAPNRAFATQAFASQIIYNVY